MVAINWFTKGRIQILVAWGATIRSISRCQGIPRALAASLCPGSIAWIPERTISAMYAPVFNDMESTPAVMALNVTPRLGSPK